MRTNELTNWEEKKQQKKTSIQEDGWKEVQKVQNTVWKNNFH